jgi:hypothetical protein
MICWLKALWHRLYPKPEPIRYYHAENLIERAPKEIQGAMDRALAQSAGSKSDREGR